MSNFITRLLAGADEREADPRSPELIAADVREAARRDAIREAAEHSRHQPAPESLSVIGAAVKGLDRARASYSTRQAALTAEIDRLTEERRQVTLALSAVNHSLAVFAGDPALTPEQRDMVDTAAPVNISPADISVDEE